MIVGTYLGDADDHVADRRFERVDGTGLLLAAEPNANADESTISLLDGLLHFLHLAGNVGEVLGNLTTATFDGNFPGVHSALNCDNKRKLG